ALLDSGAQGKFIDQNFAKQSGFITKPLPRPITTFNIDGTPNKKGTIKSFVTLETEISGRKSKELFLVTGLGKQKLIIGFPWLKKHNPIVDWKAGKL
ncbi:hypothetical protein GALMADRAFT_24744, partial [Galerina marginata CBS 339.88]